MPSQKREKGTSDGSPREVPAGYRGVDLEFGCSRAAQQKGTRIAGRWHAGFIFFRGKFLGNQHQDQNRQIEAAGNADDLRPETIGGAIDPVSTGLAKARPRRLRPSDASRRSL